MRIKNELMVRGKDVGSKLCERAYKNLRDALI